MEFKIVERYYSVTVTKWSEFGNQNKFLERLGDVVEKSNKNWNRAQWFQPTKRWFHPADILNQSSMLIIFCTSTFLAVIILQPEAVKLGAPSNSYKDLNLSRCCGGLRISVTSTFMQGHCKSGVMDYLFYYKL